MRLSDVPLVNLVRRSFGLRLVAASRTMRVANVRMGALAGTTFWHHAAHCTAHWHGTVRWHDSATLPGVDWPGRAD